MGAIGLAGLFCSGEASHYRDDIIDGSGCDSFCESIVIRFGTAAGLDQRDGWNEHGGGECECFESVV